MKIAHSLTLAFVCLLALSFLIGVAGVLWFRLSPDTPFLALAAEPTPEVVVTEELRAPDDEEGMAEAVLGVLEDPQLRMQMAEDARRDAVADFGAASADSLGADAASSESTRRSPCWRRPGHSLRAMA